MDLLFVLQHYSAAHIAAATLLGLVVGSFLNVVIHRLPRMMEREWRTQCQELLGHEHAERAADSAAAAAHPRFDLAFPGSHCPHCHHKIRAIDNIPIISYLFLRGKCGACGAHISLRYPIVEAFTGVLSGLVAWKFGFHWATGAALLFTWALVALTFIDYDTQLLPDSITLPLVWAGLLLSLGAVFVDAHSSIIGGAAGYLSLWAVYHLFRLLTGKEGMGFGDFKLFAAFGTWLGWQGLPLIILLSSLVGAVVGIGLIVLRGRDKNIPIPFGPYLAGAGWIYLMWGDTILARYYAQMGVGL
jgi:leader peptidase (prepilin peptidase)/N-methyltransferase